MREARALSQGLPSLTVTYWYSSQPQRQAPVGALVRNLGLVQVSVAVLWKRLVS